MFDGEQIEYQKYVDGYRTDIFFTEYDAAIECDKLTDMSEREDESNHSNRCSNYENDRESYIRKRLGCRFIRFNPDDTNFDINNIHNTIFRYMKDSVSSLVKKKSDTTEVDRPIKRTTNDHIVATNIIPYISADCNEHSRDVLIEYFRLNTQKYLEELRMIEKDKELEMVRIRETMRLEEIKEMNRHKETIVLNELEIKRTTETKNKSI